MFCGWVGVHRNTRFTMHADLKVSPEKTRTCTTPVVNKHSLALALTHALSQTYKRPKRRKVREYAFWKRREVVVVKTKHAESRSEEESGLTLEFLSCTRTHQ